MHNLRERNKLDLVLAHVVDLSSTRISTYVEMQNFRKALVIAQISGLVAVETVELQVVEYDPDADVATALGVVRTFDANGIGVVEVDSADLSSPNLQIGATLDNGEVGMTGSIVIVRAAERYAPVSQADLVFSVAVV